MELRNAEDLRSVYREPLGAAVDKVINGLDQHCVDFLARSPMMILSSADGAGNCDASPKGGEPGFVQALDGKRLAWADYAGNNRLDSFENVLQNNRVATLFMVPGLNETLRVNGVAELSTDADLCARFVVGDKPARVVVILTVDEAYIHCSKAFRHASLWQPDTWASLDGMASGPCMVRDHAALDLDDETFESWYATATDESLFTPGGDADQAD